MRNAVTDEPQAIHRTALTNDARKFGRMMFGVAAGAVIKIDRHPDTRLGIAEGLETALSVTALGWEGPMWAAASAPSLKAVPVIQGVTLTVFADNDENGVGQSAAYALAARWAEESESAFVERPADLNDFNDVLLEVPAHA